MPQIQNPNAILNGYNIDCNFGVVNKYYQLGVSAIHYPKICNPHILPCPPCFLSLPKRGTVFNSIPRLVGFDLPVLIDTKEKYKGTIAILGQDALRDPNDPCLMNFNQVNDIAVGLPYAIAFDKKYKNNIVYHPLIEDILKAGYNVYLTDIWKSWDNNKKKPSRMGSWNNLNPHKQCLDYEFTNTKIDYIILMGGVAQKRYNSIAKPNCIIDIAVPHLSPSANGKWKDVLKHKPVDVNNKISYIKDQLRAKGIQI